MSPKPGESGVLINLSDRPLVIFSQISRQSGEYLGIHLIAHLTPVNYSFNSTFMQKELYSRGGGIWTFHPCEFKTIFPIFPGKISGMPDQFKQNLM